MGSPLGCLPRGGGAVLWNLAMFSFCAVLSVFEAVAVAVGLDDVNAVGNADKPMYPFALREDELIQHIAVFGLR